MSRPSPQNLTINSQFRSRLPGELSNSNSPRQTENVCWSHCTPTPVIRPQIRQYFSEVAEILQISDKLMTSKKMEAVLSGNDLLEGMQPYSACYGGHQFGHWAGQLGDGRAITLGEVETADNQSWDIQLKGAGLTPYSRTADGRAVLRSSIREFLCSEAMHHLGIPTTRALSLVTTGESVVRDMMYDGNAAAEPGAIVCRAAPSFIRFGNFEILAARQEFELLKQLINFTIERDFPLITGSRNQKHAEWFHQVCEKSAHMVIEWQRVGFVHGVMNTDNMSILGLTIDYGPYGWLDNYDPNWTPNTTDNQNKRYRFENQPDIVRWNLIALANALATVIDDHDIFRTAISLFDLRIKEGLEIMQQKKFGLYCDSIDSDTKALNQSIITEGYQLLESLNADHTLFFSHLNTFSLTKRDDFEAHLFGKKNLHDNEDGVFYTHHSDNKIKQLLADWFDRYSVQKSLSPLSEESQTEMMESSNPLFILRNYLVQEAIDLATDNDFSKVSQLMERLKTPYKPHVDDGLFTKKRPDWALNKPGCSMLSCSS